MFLSYNMQANNKAYAQIAAGCFDSTFEIQYV